MGPLEGAKKQREFSSVVENILIGFVDRCSDVGESDIFVGQLKKTLLSLPYGSTDATAPNIIRKRKCIEPVMTSPILEILQARHDVLYARLFNS